MPKSSAKEIGGILEGIVDMTIEDIQDLLVEREVDEADLMEMTVECQIDSNEKKA